MQASGTIKVSILHSDPVVRAGIGAILARHQNMHFTSQELDGRSGNCHIDVIVTDYHSGLRLCDEVHAHPHDYPRILVVTAFDKEWTVRQAVNRGVSGYVLQNCDAEELVRAIHALKRGHSFLSDAVAHCVVDSLRRETLTAREIEVLQLLALGLCNKNIARDLDIGVGTVKMHLKGIMGKLDATARTHALVLAAQRGLIESEFASKLGNSRASSAVLAG